MIAIAIKGLLARPSRTILTALAIVLGVATVSAAFTLSDTMRRAANELSSSAYDGTAAVVEARTPVKRDNDGMLQQPSIPASVVAQVRRVPGVAAAAGDITSTEAKMVTPQGKLIGSGPWFGVGLDRAARTTKGLTPFRLTKGAWATGPGEVVIDAATANKQHLGLGDTIRVAGAGPARAFRVSGVATFGSVKALGTATTAIFDLPTAQSLMGKAGRVDSVLVAAKPGTSPAQVRRNLAAALPALHVDSAAHQDRYTLDGLKSFVKIIKVVLLAFAGIALLVGAFTIFNSLSITVAQRSREFGLLRLAGASRRQVLRTVVAEALAIGFAAAVAGLAVGIGLAKLLNSLFQQLGIDLPQTGTVFATRTVIVSLLLGTLVTLLAGLLPAWRATRVAPVEALRDAASTGRRLRLPARTVRALVSIVGRPVARTGGSAGMLARRNAMRAPGRTMITASALTIGVALVCAVAVLAAGLRDSTRGSLEKRVTAGYVLSGEDGWEPIDQGAARAAAALPGVRTASAIRQDVVRAYGKTEGINAVDPATIGRVVDLKWKHGSKATLAALGSAGAVIDDGWAKKHKLGVGDAFSIVTPANRTLRLTVRGVQDSPVVDALGLGPITIGTAAYRAGGFAGTSTHLTFIDAPGASTGALQRAVAGYPGAKVFTKSAYIAQQTSWVDQILGIFYVLLALAVIVSLFGLANTLVLATFERTREIGMLRAVGMTRRQLRRMVRRESIITALLGVTVGVVLGLALAEAVVAKWGSLGFTFAVPAGTLVALAVVACVAGTVAAMLPARRAGRMSVLGALAYE
ncbi:MAG: ABC transporter permease [Solirubrobacteraceae bacterium]